MDLLYDLLYDRSISHRAAPLCAYSCSGDSPQGIAAVGPSPSPKLKTHSVACSFRSSL